MKYVMDLFLVGLVVFSLSACDDPPPYTFTPDYICTNDTIRLHVDLDEEMTFVRLRDNNNTLIHEERDSDTFDASDVVNQGKLQYRVRVKKEIDWWFDYDERFESNFRLYDNPAWSPQVAGSYVGNLDMGSHAYAGSTTTYDSVCVENCLNTQPENPSCVDMCPIVQACVYEWDPVFHAEKMTWIFPDGVFSGRLRVKGVRNNTNETIKANFINNIAPGEEEMFGGTGYPVSSFSLSVDYNPTKEFECDTVSVPMLCTSNPELDKRFLPSPSDCAGRGQNVRLYLECTDG